MLKLVYLGNRVPGLGANFSLVFKLYKCKFFLKCWSIIDYNQLYSARFLASPVVPWCSEISNDVYKK